MREGWIQTKVNTNEDEYSNTNEYEYKTIKPYKRTVLNKGLLDSGLVQL